MSRNLEPEDPDFVNDEKLDKVQWTLDLRGRDLRNASLSGADLRKGRLDGAQLQGASLNGAQLQGASLSKAQLQRAFLRFAQLQGASLYWAQLWRASVSGHTGSDLVDLVVPHGMDRWTPFTPYSVDEARQLVVSVSKSIPDGGQGRMRAEQRLARLLREWTPDEEAALQAWLAKVQDVPPDHDVRLTDFLVSLACAGSDDGAVAKGVVRRVVWGRQLGRNEDHVRFAKRVLDSSCEGAKGLPAEDRNTLRRMAESKR